MFIRKRKNPSGSVSVQVIKKSKDKYRVVKTIGCTKDPAKLERLEWKAEKVLQELRRQLSLPLLYPEQVQAAKVLENITDPKVKVIGPELVLGKIFNQIGLGGIEDRLLRHLVIARIAYPGSKLKTVDYLEDYLGIETQVQQIYRLMDRINREHKEDICKIVFAHSKKVLGGEVRVVFYDVTTLHYEAAYEDDLRRIGYSKAGKFNRPQILLALIVGERGYPFAYAVFEGNRFEGHTLLPTLERLNKNFSLPQATVVADSAMLSKENIALLEDKGYEYIIGARIKNESKEIKQRIINHDFENNKILEIEKRRGVRLIVSYSRKRARKDAHNRQRGLQRLEEKMGSGKLTKKQINDRGYNKFLKMEGKVRISIDQGKVKEDGRWDGLKGYLTNSSSSGEQIIKSYSYLWEIEKAFRISKTDLMIRPIFHRRQKRIEAHICIAFAAYAVYKELERQLVGHDISPQAAVESLRTVYEVNFEHQDLPGQEYRRRTRLNKTQKTILEIFD